MDNPGISLFQGADIQINNSQNVEEEEDLEDQLRRKAELQNLLQTNLDDFKYDDSTINSSNNVSLISVDNLDEQYKNAVTPQEQLKVLYDVRCRELQAIKADYEKFKRQKTEEIDSQTKQKLLIEAELRQLSISLKNAENLLVDKTETINELKTGLEQRDGHIKKLENLVKNNEEDIATYKSEITELHLKLQSHTGPFSLNAKYNSEEFKKSLQTKIEQLEHSLESESEKLNICNSEKEALRDEVERLVVDKLALEKDNDIILRNLYSAQEQCKELIDVIEVLKQENDHFKGRINEFEHCNKDTLLSRHNSSEDPFNNSQNEKLKKMLVDKSVELDSLKAKLKNYEKGLRELAEYRQLKCDIWKKDFRKCDNQDHARDILLLQNEVQNYKTQIEDKNRQIFNLNSNNKDLKEKIEEMLLQTRNEIQNISSKYNMPQLEIMRKELEQAEIACQTLSEKLEESEERRLSLLQKLENLDEEKENEEIMSELLKCREDLKIAKTQLETERAQNRVISAELEYKKNEILNLKNRLEDLKIQSRKSKRSQSPRKSPNDQNENIKSDCEALKKQLKNVMEHLEQANKKEPSERALEIGRQMDEFLQEIEEKPVEKGLVEERINSWKKLLGQIEEKDADEIKNQYKEAITNLHAVQEKLKEAEDTIQDLKNSITMAEGEKCTLHMELKENAQKLLDLEKEIDRLEMKNKELKSREQNEAKNSANENFQKELAKLTEELNSKLSVSMQVIKRFEQEKKETKKLLEKMKKQIHRLEEDNLTLRSAKSQMEIDNLRASKMENNVKIAEEEEMVKCELKLRDELQIEYQKRISDIERRYQKTFKEATELYKSQNGKLEEQDKKFREYLKVILTECDTCTTTMQQEKLELLTQLRSIQKEFELFKITTFDQEQKYKAMLKEKDTNLKKNEEAWKQYSKKIVCNCLDIEATNRNVRERILASMDRYDKEVETIQTLGDVKFIKKSVKKKKT